MKTYGKSEVVESTEGIKFRAIELSKKYTFRWYKHVREMPEGRQTKNVYHSIVTGV